jgi:hypothetical protein
MRKKEISTDKLLQILEQIPKNRIQVSKSPSAEQIRQYVNFYNIQPGDFWIPSYIIYNHYLNWCKEHKPFNDRIFFREFKKYFARKREFLFPFYKVSLESLGLSYVDYEKIMVEVRDAQKETNRRNNKKHRENKKNKAE